MPSVIVDSGPLYALFNANDRHHLAALDFTKRTRDRLETNLAVIFEVTHFLQENHAARADFLTWVTRSLSIDNETISDIPRINQLLQKYSDLPADFADASLFAMAERRNIRKIATTDSDFQVYRALGKQPFENVFWEQS
jgi:uncharacterized protein